MNNNLINVNSPNGIGDKFIDLLGAFTFCKFLNYKPNINFIANHSHMDILCDYDLKLFEFHKDISFGEKNTKYYFNSILNGNNINPYKLYKYLKKIIPNITFNNVIDEYLINSKEIIKPSNIIIKNIPIDIENAYGIHLRKSDKITDNGDMRHENSYQDFLIIINELIKDITEIIINEENPSFFISSEDYSWRDEFTNKIINIANNNNKKITIIKPNYLNNENYHNYASVLDLFCLSKCKEIFQGVKYSHFSIIASLLGSRKLRNYAHITNNYNICLINSFRCVLNINNEALNLNIDENENFNLNINDTDTNINAKYSN